MRLQATIRRGMPRPLLPLRLWAGLGLVAAAAAAGPVTWAPVVGNDCGVACSSVGLEPVSTGTPGIYLCRVTGAYEDWVGAFSGGGVSALTGAEGTQGCFVNGGSLSAATLERDPSCPFADGYQCGCQAGSPAARPVWVPASAAPLCARATSLAAVHEWRDSSAPLLTQTVCRGSVRGQLLTGATDDPVAGYSLCTTNGYTYDYATQLGLPAICSQDLFGADKFEFLCERLAGKLQGLTAHGWAITTGSAAARSQVPASRCQPPGSGQPAAACPA